MLTPEERQKLKAAGLGSTGTTESMPVKSLSERLGVQQAKEKVEPTFKASMGGLGSIIPNVAKTVGNIPSSAARILEMGVVEPAENIGKSIETTRDIYKERGAIEGTKDIAKGFGETAKSKFKALGEFIVGVNENKLRNRELSPVQEEALRQRDVIVDKLAKYRAEGKDTASLMRALKYNQEALGDLAEEIGTPEERDNKTTETLSNIAKYPIERPLDVPLALETGGPKSNVSKVASPVTRGANTSLSNIASKTVSKTQNSLRTRLEANMVTDVDQMLNKTKGVIGKTQLATKKNVDLKTILSEPAVFKGIKVEGGKINPDDAIGVVTNRKDALLDAKRTFLPEVDKYVPKISKEVVRSKALKDIKGKFSPADEVQEIADINRQLDALPDELSLEEWDKLRAVFRKSARDAKGLQKKGSEYASLENATRDAVFDATDDLPFDVNKEYQAINNTIKDLIETETFLDKTLRGQVVKGGRLTNLIGRGVGAIAGSSGGVLGTIGGSEVGGMVANIITNNQLGSSVKYRLIKELTSDPEILKKAQELLQKAQKYTPPQLPAPKTNLRSQKVGGKTINLPAKSTSTRDAEEIKRIQGQLPVRKADMSLQNTPIKIKAKSSIPSKSTTKGLKVKGETPTTKLEAQAKTMSKEEFIKSSDFKVEYSRNKLKVAEDGKPITVTVYHGSPDARFAEEFIPTKTGYFKDAPDLLPDNKQWNELYGSTGGGFKSGKGVYEGISFTDDARVAKSYADKPAFDSQNSVPMVLERTVTLNKPKVIDVAKGEWNISLEKTIEQAKKQGYDGIIFKNIKDNYHPSTTKNPSNNIIVFNEKNIKTKSQLEAIWNKANKKINKK